MSDEDRFRAPKGTKDILPDQIGLWRRMEEAARVVCARYGYEEVRTPAFEHTALFHKTTGETTDIVEKEMFTFGENGKFSLRPEMTPSVVRVIVQHNLHRQKGFWKLFYIGPAFRHEQPQEGRQWQFHQFGVEAIGSHDARVDVETILVYCDFLRESGLKKWKLRINSIGCPDCREKYRDALRAAVDKILPTLCKNCNYRHKRNVLRVLDCKEDEEKTNDLPKIMDYVCDACRAHFAEVEKGLRAAKVEYRVNPRLVRGLDYYTRTVYEFTGSKKGAMDSICGGGRYDTLVRDMGGPDLGSVGFASGMERMYNEMVKQGVEPDVAHPDFFAVAVADDFRDDVFLLTHELRSAGLRGDMDYEGRSLKAQMRAANKTGARYTLLLGKDELDAGVVKIKDMQTSQESNTPRGEVAKVLKGE